LEREGGDSADQGADEDDEGDAIFMEADGLGESFDGERAIGIELVIAGLVRLVGGIEQFLR